MSAAHLKTTRNIRPIEEMHAHLLRGAGDGCEEKFARNFDMSVRWAGGSLSESSAIVDNEPVEMSPARASFPPSNEAILGCVMLKERSSG